MEQTGEAIDQDHLRFVEEARLQQSAYNENVRRFIQEGNHEGLSQLAEAQTKLDHQIHRRLSEHYAKERSLRLEAVKVLKERRLRLIQLQEETKQNQLKRSDLVQDTKTRSEVGATRS